MKNIMCKLLSLVSGIMCACMGHCCFVGKRCDAHSSKCNALIGGVDDKECAQFNLSTGELCAMWWLCGIPGMPDDGGRI